MPGDKIYEDLTVVVRRAKAAAIVLAGVVALALGYYWKTQILDYGKYWELAEANKTRVRYVSAARGVIRDRNGKLLADNKASFKVSLVRENIKDPEDTARRVSELLGITLDEYRARLERYRSVPLFEPVVIKDGLTDDEIAPIESRRKEFRELLVEAEPKRDYPGGSLAAHVLGYLQERTPEEIRGAPERNFRVGDMGGRAGAEFAYDARLTGQDGKIRETVDSLGRAREVQSEEKAVQGTDLELNIDARLQAEAEKLLDGREGAIVAMNPQNGEILVMASYPTFDPNKFISRFTPAEWLELANDPASPLQNRAVRGLYSPGSIFKPVMALGGLDLGFVTPATTAYCNGSAEYFGVARSCWFRAGHGAMNLAEAIRNSCNIYFYNLGRDMGIDRIAQTAEGMGLGRKTGLDLPGEKDGLVPSTEWKKKTLKQPWYGGETISVAIGQGQLLVTPVQVAALTAAIANRGRMITPHVVRESPSTRETRTAPFRAETFESVIEGMWRSVNAGGTGAGAFVDGLNVCGKTGSTELVSKETAERLARAGKVIKTHSWFSGFAPRTSPKIVVTVLIEYGGGGGATAAPVAGQIFRAFEELTKK